MLKTAGQGATSPPSLTTFFTGLEAQPTAPRQRGVGCPCSLFWRRPQLQGKCFLQETRGLWAAPPSWPSPANSLVPSTECFCSQLFPPLPGPCPSGLGAQEKLSRTKPPPRPSVPRSLHPAFPVPNNQSTQSVKCFVYFFLLHPGGWKW